jgi:hypothetical protein
MSGLRERAAAERRDGANLALISRRTADPRIHICGFEMLAAWTAHLVGAAIVLSVIAGLTGYRREWSAAAAAAWLLLTPALLGWGALLPFQD